MNDLNIKEFAKTITKLINKENLSREEAFDAFMTVLKAETSDIQQGAFLAALTAKGETKDEIASCWQAIYEFDTVKQNPVVDGDIVENSGTGMDSFKTFNISTVASIVAASYGVPMARHGARALSSKCGTVDIAEALGVNVECDVEVVTKSLEQSNLGLYNGMSPKTHPMALGRILSQISFGSTLNIAASLASPVKATIGVRGVYSPEVIRPTIEVMKEIGYRKAIVYCGKIEDNKFIDEAMTSNTTYIAELDEQGEIIEYELMDENSESLTAILGDIKPMSIDEEKDSILSILKGKGNENRINIVALNAGLIFYAYGKTKSIDEGTILAKNILQSGKAIDTLNKWIEMQS
jgi:anthranilate phosphoribosyltransferase